MFVENVQLTMPFSWGFKTKVEWDYNISVHYQCSWTLISIGRLNHSDIKWGFLLAWEGGLGFTGWCQQLNSFSLVWAFLLQNRFIQLIFYLHIWKLIIVWQLVPNPYAWMTHTPPTLFHSTLSSWLTTPSSISMSTALACDIFVGTFSTNIPRVVL